MVGLLGKKRPLWGKNCHCHWWCMCIISWAIYQFFIFSHHRETNIKPRIGEIVVLMGYDVRQCIVVGECLIACSASVGPAFCLSKQGKFWWYFRSFPFLHLQTGWLSWWRLVSHRFPSWVENLLRLLRQVKTCCMRPHAFLIVGY